MKQNFGNKYIKTGITIFVAGAALILFYGFVNNFNVVSQAFSVIIGILSPFVYGMVLAYLLCPIYNGTVRVTYRLWNVAIKKKKNALCFSRVIGTISALLFLFIILGGFLWMVIPELISSIIGIIQVLPSRINNVLDWANSSINKHPEMVNAFGGILTNATDNLVEWAQKEFIPGTADFMNGVSQGIVGTLTAVMNVFIGIIVSVYVLNSKEKFKAQTKKFILATTKKETAEEIFSFGAFTNKTFGGFINGKIIDSIIIGVLCFIAMNVLKLPLPMLISVIIGLTNVIPFFGPFIGAIPATLIIFLISPKQAIYFLLMVLVLQQLDGNVIGPKILGGTTGIASFWVMFSIIVGGGLFGFIGMILSVPFFAVFYYYMSKYIKKRLAKKELVVETIEYEDFSKYNIDKEELR